ncbi:DNA primase [Lacticaseibacillus pabuli]|uniref:DNA primase n=1 Tax=Lacticaseibacillus pabuli TaxID=3025672 RepID=A0ABY7WUE9_9LACO|nr:DNA primase [Lacticaseibacillus sp. KACC 23028]WDF83793.1 DNA primase [Lacticaseibacillus sp. KACC 23028]
MARIAPDKIDEIKNAVNIADYIGQTVQLKKQGQNLFGLCPFHDENTPSFSVNEDKQIFYCFSCHRGGSVFKFVQELDKLPFPQAVKKVADYAGIPLELDDAPQHREDPVVKRQKEILKLTGDFMHHLLMNTESGQAGLDYVQKRGMTEATLKQFGIGYAPDDRELLHTFLSKQNVSEDEMRASGLFVERDDGSLHARFTNRVMFPLRDSLGITVGFSGRTLTTDKRVAKYLNSPETKIFSKGDLLFNLDEARPEVRAGAPFYLFEGFMDVISAYQAGVKSGVASMGTSLTRSQVQTLERLGKQLVVAYDGDDAGQHATTRALDMLQGSQLDVSAVVFPGGKDPDEFIKQNGAEQFQAQLQHVLTPTAFALHELSRGVDMSNDHDKFAYIDQALAEVNKVQDALERSVYVKQIAERTGAPEDAVTAKLAELPTYHAQPQQDNTATYDEPAPAPADYGDDGLVPPPPTDDPFDQTVPVSVAPAAAPAPLGRLGVAERELLSYMLQDAEVTLAVSATPRDWATDDYGQLIARWLDFSSGVQLEVGMTPNYQGFLDQQTESDAALISAALNLLLPPADDSTAPSLLQVINREELRAHLQDIKSQLRDARQVGDVATQNRLSVDYFNLMRQLQSER